MGISKISPIREQKSPTSPDARDDNEPQMPHISPSPKVGKDAEFFFLEVPLRIILRAKDDI